MSTFNQFVKNQDAYCDMYTPLLYLEKGMKPGKEKFRALNRVVKHTSLKANEIGASVQSSSEAIKLALNSFAGAAPVVQSLNKIGTTINKKLEQFNNQISGIKPAIKQPPPKETGGNDGESSSQSENGKKLEDKNGENNLILGKSKKSLQESQGYKSPIY